MMPGGSHDTRPAIDRLFGSLQSLAGPVMTDVVLDTVTQCPAVEYISF